MELLGLDKKGKENRRERSWKWVKSWFESKIEELSDMIVNRKEQDMNGKQKLEYAVFGEIVDPVQNQLSKTDYFTRSDEEVNIAAMKYAPLTNLGCETEFSKLDNRIKACGGSTSIQPLSRTNVIVSNGLLINSDFESKSAEEKQKC